MVSKKALNKFSKILTQSKSQGASQAMLYALKLKKRDMKKPQIFRSSTFSKTNVYRNLYVSPVGKNI